VLLPNMLLRIVSTAHLCELGKLLTPNDYERVPGADPVAALLPIRATR